MEQDSWSRLELLFEQATRLPGQERSSFLRAQCGNDVALLKELEDLIAQDAILWSEFLEPKSPQPRLRCLPGSDRPDPLIGQNIASYAINGIIARGGMGTVYLAEQANPRRLVALKVIHPGAWTISAEKRFDVESRILANLSHPNIAQVFEAGTYWLASGNPVHFFAMEYVPGSQPITQYLADRNLALRDRLNLYLHLCDAVQHSHQKGVIHRDLKPGNILVDPEGRVKVIDFGIARATDSDIAITTMHTEAGQLLGTLSYMSPEQCDADPFALDVRTDVYSLGVVLYEVLCGQLPYDVSRTNVYSAVKTIREAMPARPSTVSRLVPGEKPIDRDLEAIVLKTIEKEKQKRYASVSDLASDIRCYLAGDPIAARPPSSWTRVTRWAARHPVGATTSLCLAIAAIAIGATVVGIHFANVRPFGLEYGGKQDSVFLVSYAGRRLNEWDSHAAGGVNFADAKFVKDSRGHRIAILGFSEESNIYPGELCAFDVDTDLREPIWTHRVEIEKDGPPFMKTKDRSRWGFGVKHLIVADVFPDSSSSGSEIIAVFTCNYSLRCVRIYNLAGKRLCEFWQDGGVLRPYWMAKPGLLVFPGANEHEKCDDVQFAPVVFAIQPQPNSISDNDPSQSPFSLGVQPRWYRYLLPPSLGRPAIYEMESLDLLADTGNYSPEAHARLGLTISHSDDPKCRGGIRFLINEKGDEIPGARSRSDDFVRNRFCLPNEDSFRLSDVPWSQLSEAERQRISTTSRSTE